MQTIIIDITEPQITPSILYFVIRSIAKKKKAKAVNISIVFITLLIIALLFVIMTHFIAVYLLFKLLNFLRHIIHY